MKEINTNKVFISHLIIGYEDYGVSVDGKILHLKKFLEVPMRLVGYTYGYYLAQDFVSRRRLATILAEIEVKVVKRASNTRRTKSDL